MIFRATAIRSLPKRAASVSKLRTRKKQKQKPKDEAAVRSLPLRFLKRAPSKLTTRKEQKQKQKDEDLYYKERLKSDEALTSPARFSDDSAFETFRRLFNDPSSSSSSSSSPSSPSSSSSSPPSSSSASPASPPPPLRTALSSLVEFSSVFSTRRLARGARDPRNKNKPRIPPPHYDRFELEFKSEKPTRKVRSIPDERTRPREDLEYVVKQPEPRATEVPTPLSPTLILNAIHARYRHFLSHPDVRTVLDIGAGSGSWSLFAGYKIALNPVSAVSAPPSTTPYDNLHDFCLHPSRPSPPKIIAIDTSPLPFLPTIQRIQGCITSPLTPSLIDTALASPTLPDFVYTSPSVKIPRSQRPGTRAPRGPVQTVDVVLCDVVASNTGCHMVNASASLEMCRRVWNAVSVRLRTEDQVGRKGAGVLLLRHVAHPLLARFRTSVLAPHFQMVKYIRPRGAWSDRDGKVGSYFLCWGYKGVEAGKKRVWT
ncbi:hypothetical protein C0989_000913 [Termitomyces sp. Mn162]|nr:hypothetical protein C0989_000913 [Termitomyces sp. Mn162]